MKNYAFPEYLDHHPLTFLNHITPYLQKLVQDGQLSPHQALILNFPGICQLLQSNELNLEIVKTWNFRQALAINNWACISSSILLETMLVYVEVEDIYNKLCFHTIFEWFIQDKVDISQITQLTEKHCLTLVLNKQILMELIPSWISIEAFIQFNVNQLYFLNYINQEMKTTIIQNKMDYETILAYLNKKITYIEYRTPTSHINPEVNLEAYYKAVEEHGCSNARSLIESKVVSLELSQSLNDAEWLTIDSWYYFHSTCSYEEMLTHLREWSSIEWRRYCFINRLLYLDKFISEGELSYLNTNSIDDIHQNYDSVVVPLLEAKVIPVEQLLLFPDFDLLKEHLPVLLSGQISYLDLMGLLDEELDLECLYEEESSEIVEEQEQEELHYRKRRKGNTSFYSGELAAHNTFFSLTNAQSSITLSDGNCAYNGIVLFIRELFINQGETPETERFAKILLSYSSFIAQNMTHETDLHHYFKEKPIVEIQKMIAPILRHIVVETMQNPENQYQALLFERLNMAILYNAINPNDPNIPDSDTFFVHPFIQEKWLELKKVSDGDLEFFCNSMEVWWMTEGFQSYLKEISKSAQSGADVARWGGALEMDILRKKFGFRIKLTKFNAGHEYLGETELTTCEMHNDDGVHWYYKGISYSENSQLNPTKSPTLI